MKTMGSRRFKKITYAFVIIALLLLPTLPIVTAFGSRITIGPAVPPDGGGGGPWIRGVAAWITYETHILEPDRIDLSANVIASIPLGEMELIYIWEIDGSMIRSEKNVTVYIDDIGLKKIVHIRLMVCSERSNSCAVDEKDIALVHWPIIGSVSVFFSILIIAIIMYEKKPKNKFKSWI